jgi:hypothetical protein
MSREQQRKADLMSQIMLFRSTAAETFQNDQSGWDRRVKFASHHVKYLEMRVGRWVGFPTGENAMQGIAFVLE